MHYTDMKKITFLFLLLLFSEHYYSQTFAYSFNGEISKSEQESLRKEVFELPGVNSYELKIKQDSKKGEIIFSLENQEISGENNSSFSPVDLKALLIYYKLEPIDFRQVKK